MGKLVRFGGGSRVFLFDETNGLYPQSYNDNFSNLVPATVRLPGQSGGFDQYGHRVAPTEVGRITQTFTMRSEDPEDMEARRDTVKALVNWGVRPLYFQPTDPEADERVCWARFNNISKPNNQAGHSDLFQTVSIDFQVKDPRWFGPGTHTFTYNDGTLYDGSANYGGSPISLAASGYETETTLTNDGTAPAELRVQVITAADETCQNPLIERLDEAGGIVERAGYLGVLGNSEEWMVDPLRKRVLLNARNAFNDTFHRITASWITLEPGDNTIRVKFQNPGDEATVWFSYYEVYR